MTKLGISWERNARAASNTLLFAFALFSFLVTLECNYLRTQEPSLRDRKALHSNSCFPAMSLSPKFSVIFGVEKPNTVQLLWNSKVIALQLVFRKETLILFNRHLKVRKKEAVKRKLF